MRILVVDDDVRLARQIASALTEAGHDPVVIHDGETALHEAVEVSFDLMVLDVGLPRMDGFEVLRRLRSRHVTSRILMLTARSQTKDRITGLQLGADDYLPKPFAMPELVARVRAPWPPVCGRPRAQPARWRSHARPGESRGIPRYASNPIVSA